jgi:hypothetical protein
LPEDIQKWKPGPKRRGRENDCDLDEFAKEGTYMMEAKPHCGEDHVWIAVFFESGRLAYWECENCGEKDREIGQLPERLDTISGWIKSPPVLVSRGARPAASNRRWITRAGSILVEGDPSSTHFVGKPIPGLAEAHSYVMYDANGTIEEVYEPVREQPWRYTDHYWLIRYQVIGADLVRFESHCYEDSTYEVPNAGEPKQIVVLSGLRGQPSK